jgi:hypothetical protein
MNVKEWIARGQCPSCWNKNLQVSADYIKCEVCGIHGNPEHMSWCEHVPVFRKVGPESKTEGMQLYKTKVNDIETYYICVGTVEGCGRVIGPEGFCTSCREFLPAKTDHQVKGSVAKPARAPSRARV